MKASIGVAYKLFTDWPRSGKRTGRLFVSIGVAFFAISLYDSYMATLIATILFGLIITYFALQNTENISLNFLNYTIPSIPTYFVIMGSLLIGLLFSWIVSLVNGIFTSFTMHGKDSKIKNINKEKSELTKRIQELEIENAKLETKLNDRTVSV